MLFIVDFGLAGSYLDREGNHRPFKEKTGSYFGTPAYMSINSHKMSSVSRRDDLESLGYVTLRLFTGTTPWLEELRGKSFTTDEQKKERNNLIREIKERPLKETFKKMPHPFFEFMEKIRALRFE